WLELGHHLAAHRLRLLDLDRTSVEQTTIDSHVSHLLLRRMRHELLGDPVLELERCEFPEFIDALGHPDDLDLRHSELPHSLRGHLARGRGDVDPDPTTPVLLSDRNRRSAANHRVEND